jgi:hypothetical protein
MNSDFILGLMPVMGVDGFDDIVGVIFMATGHVVVGGITVDSITRVMAALMYVLP